MGKIVQMILGGLLSSVVVPAAMVGLVITGFDVAPVYSEDEVANINAVLKEQHLDMVNNLEESEKLEFDISEDQLNLLLYNQIDSEVVNKTYHGKEEGEYLFKYDYINDNKVYIQEMWFETSEEKVMLKANIKIMELEVTAEIGVKIIIDESEIFIQLEDMRMGNLPVPGVITESIIKNLPFKSSKEEWYGKITLGELKFESSLSYMIKELKEQNGDAQMISGLSLIEDVDVVDFNITSEGIKLGLVLEGLSQTGYEPHQNVEYDELAYKNDMIAKLTESLSSEETDFVLTLPIEKINKMLGREFETKVYCSIADGEEDILAFTKENVFLEEKNGTLFLKTEYKMNNLYIVHVVEIELIIKEGEIAVELISSKVGEKETDTNDLVNLIAWQDNEFLFLTKTDGAIVFDDLYILNNLLGELTPEESLIKNELFGDAVEPLSISKENGLITITYKK